MNRGTRLLLLLAIQLALFLPAACIAPLFRHDTGDGVLFFAALLAPFAGVLVFAWRFRLAGEPFWVPLAYAAACFAVLTVAFAGGWIWRGLLPEILYPPEPPFDRSIVEIVHARLRDSEMIFSPVLAGFGSVVTLRLLDASRRGRKLFF